MAEKARTERQQQPPPKVARRPSFRRTLRDNESLLPSEYLELLENKRKQLDDSIHKYVAAKEREYKQYEKDLRAQARTAAGCSTLPAVQTQDGNAHVQNNGPSSASKRRTSSESTQDTTAGSPLLRGQHSSAVNALMASGLRRHSEAVSEDMEEDRDVATDPGTRKMSNERENEFVGLFTPPFIQSIDQDVGGKERRGSAPPNVEHPTREVPSEPGTHLMQRGESDTAVQAKAKRPAHLDLSQRTSSSGSSADGRLASAMKSPTPTNKKSRMKRVSLAIGGNIVVKPSEDVPLAMSVSSTPSHSRSRSPANEREADSTLINGSASMDFARPLDVTSAPTTALPMVNGNTAYVASNSELLPAATRQALTSGPGSAPAASTLTTSPIRPKASSRIDPDGDLFDLLAEDSDPTPHQTDFEDGEDGVDSDEEPMTGVSGRLEPISKRDQEARTSTEAFSYSSTAGLVAEPTPKPPPVDEDGSPNHAIHIEFGPSSASQPMHPGFRQPSVRNDPVFLGTNYDAVAAESVDNEIYGSSYVRQGKGSFGAGSLGESYMARHAEDMRAGREGYVRS